MKTVVIYASKLGSTRNVAAHIAGRIGSELVDLKKTQNPDLSGFERIVLGCGVYAGKPSKRMTAFVKGTDMSGKEVHLFLCCKLKGEKGDDQCEEISEMLGFPAVYFAGDDKNVPSPAIDEFVKVVSA